MHMALIVFVIAVGFPYAKSENYVPFAPFGVRGVFTGERMRVTGVQSSDLTVASTIQHSVASCNGTLF